MSVTLEFFFTIYAAENPSRDPVLLCAGNGPVVPIRKRMEAAAGCDKIQATKQRTECPWAGARRDQEIKMWRTTGVAN